MKVDQSPLGFPNNRESWNWMKNLLRQWSKSCFLRILWGISLGNLCLAGSPGSLFSGDNSRMVFRISFKDLAGFPITETIRNAKPGAVRGLLPNALLALDGQRVALVGFMLPTQLNKEKVTQFLLLRTRSACCFGVPPELNEMVEALAAKGPVTALMDTPVKVVGRLHVQEHREGTLLCSIYQIDVEDVSQDSGMVE